MAFLHSGALIKQMILELARASCTVDLVAHERRGVSFLAPDGRRMTLFADDRGFRIELPSEPPVVLSFSSLRDAVRAASLPRLRGQAA